MEKPRWDLFICHASEDKAEVVTPLANALTERGLRVWVDVSEIRLGDSLREKIDEGLASSAFGAVVLSPSFFKKAWTQAELGALFGRQMAESRILLPIWHRVSTADVRRSSPLLADIRAKRTDSGLDAVAREIYQTILRAGPRYRPGSPIFAGRLTKRAFMALPVSSYLVSNILATRYEPVISASIPPIEDRSALWRRIQEAGLASTRFYAFPDVTEFRAHIAARSMGWVEQNISPQVASSTIAEPERDVIEVLLALRRNTRNSWPKLAALPAHRNDFEAEIKKETFDKSKEALDYLASHGHLSYHTEHTYNTITDKYPVLKITVQNVTTQIKNLAKHLETHSPKSGDS